MNKLLIGLCLAVILAVSIPESCAFCGGCGCNIFNCNCDFRPWECNGVKARIAVLNTGMPADAQFIDLDLDQDGRLGFTEIVTATSLSAHQDGWFADMDINQDGYLSPMEFDREL